MNKRIKKVDKKGAAIASVEIESGAWERFEALVKNAAKMGHKPHHPAKSAKRASARTRAPSV